MGKRKPKTKDKILSPKKTKLTTDKKRGRNDDNVAGPSTIKMPKIVGDHSTGGLKTSQHGVAYQTKLLMLFYKRGVDQNLSFRLTTEWPEAEKFDDAVFIYEKAGKQVHRFLQAKHKQNESLSISVSDLFNVSSGDFSLLKYFDSYCKIKKNSLFNNPETELEDFIICTNIGFNYQSKVRNEFRLSDDIFDEVETIDNILKTKLTRFKSEFDGKDDLIFVFENHSKCKFDESDVTEFFQKLRFAVNYPNEEKLSEILETELCQQFKLTQSEIAYRIFFEKMYNWFKAKEGKFRRESDYKDMIINIEQQLSVVKLLGMSIMRRNYLSSLKISFKEETLNKIKDFLNSKNDILLLKNEISINLSSIKINQLLPPNIDTENEADDSVIFLSLSTAKNCIKQINQTLDSSSLKGKSTLFVVECDAESQMNVILLINKLISEISDLKIRIIFIESLKYNYAEGIKSMLEDFSRSVNETHLLDEENNYSNLNSETQIQLLNKIITFQGEVIQMKELISPENDDESLMIIDSETIIKLIDDELIEVGTALLNLGEIGNFYVERKLCRLTILKKDCLSNEDAIYAFKCTFDPSFLSSQKVLIVENVNSKADYDNLCKINPEKIIHWLDLNENKQIVWKWSNKCFSELRKHVDNMCEANEIYQPDDFSISENKILIISAEPGMGKTTILTRLAHFSKAKNKAQWIVRISLNDYTDDLKDLMLDDLKSVQEFLVKAVALKSNFEKQLFYSYFERPEKLIILFDGLDEVSPHYYKEVITMIKLLINRGVLVWLTARLHLKAAVENDFCTFSYDLVPFDEKNQKQFLTSFWKKSFQVDGEKAAIFLNEIMLLVSESLRDTEREFMGIPLQTQMIAENFENDIHVFCSSKAGEKKPKLPKKLKMLDMYEGFVRKKLEIYSYEKKREKHSNVTVINDNIETFEKKRQNHQLLSLFALYNREHVENFLSPSAIVEAEKFISNIEQGLDLVGIVMKINNKKPIFVHRTFAEFLAAGYFAENYSQPKIRPFLKTHLYKDEYQVIRHFLDRILAKNHQLITAVLNRDVKRINDLIPDEEQLTTLDNAGRSVLHLAASLGFTYICKQLIAELKTRLKLGVIVNSADELFLWSPLLYADNEGRWEVAEVLLDNGADATNMTKIDVIDANVEEHGDTQLHVSAQLNFLHLAKIIVKNNPQLVHVKNKDYCGRMPLNIAAKFGHMKMVQLLVANGADPLQMDDKGNTALDEASIGNYMDIKKFLISVIKNVGLVKVYTLPPKRTSNRIRFLRNETFPRNYY